MNAYVEEYGADEFFQEESVEIASITDLSSNTGKIVASLSPEEISEQEEIAVYYVTLRRDESQIEEKAFVLGKEHDGWKILRISTPTFSVAALKSALDA
jgi:hypothetical protein